MKNEHKGIILILSSAFCFAVMAASVKAVPSIPLGEKIFFRNIFGVFLMGYALYKDTSKIKFTNKQLLLLRSVLGFSGVAGYYYSLSKLPLSDAVLLNKLSPFFVIIFSLLFLKEKITKMQIYALIVALLGASLIIKPEFGFLLIPSIIGFTASAFAGGAYTVIRQLRLYAHPDLIVFTFCLFSTIASIPIIIFSGFVIPSGKELFFLILIGISATSAQILMTHGYKYAPASRLAIYGYVNIIFSVIFAIIFWSEYPDLLTTVGGILILFGGFINYFSNNNIKFRKNKSS
ncbi:DMT family transporter [Anaerovorax odorimutans]|uniref:DMT family transporter n=1 Tax=Anaerovorax odorimutans TaxID=109327 RepID=UPI000415C83D|nr:DMT family transporter [Anaerovorax odorimutans]